MPLPETSYDGCTIPPDVYAIGMGWDPQPEIERLLFLSREAGVEVHSALELGCGGGRLLAPLAQRVERVAGVELNPQMAEAARQALAAAGLVGRARVANADMCNLALGEQFDLILTSPNTIRHVLEDSALTTFWRGVAAHLAPGGIFVADLELGLAHEQGALGHPRCWAIARDESEVDVKWEVIGAPSMQRPVSCIRWTFRLRSVNQERDWSEEFELRAVEIESLLAGARRDGGLTLVNIFENREPYLLPRAPHNLDGRFIIILRGPS
jgi:SAM-dependent methyltransferase